MAVEDDVEVVNLFGDSLAAVFIVMLGRDAAVPATVEQSDDDVGTLLFSQYGDPLLGTCHHLFKVHAAPQVLVQPVGDSRRQHA